MESIARLLAAVDDWCAARRRRRALCLLAKAARIDGLVVMQTALAGVVRAGFTINKGGKEYAVFVGEKRVEPAEEAA